MKKRGLLTQTVIVLAVSAAVFVITVLILTGQFKSFGLGVKDCESKGGECVDKAIGCGYGPSFIPGCDKDEVCCIKTENE